MRVNLFFRFLCLPFPSLPLTLIYLFYKLFGFNSITFFFWDLFLNYVMFFFELFILNSIFLRTLYALGIEVWPFLVIAYEIPCLCIWIRNGIGFSIDSLFSHLINWTIDEYNRIFGTGIKGCHQIKDWFVESFNLILIVMDKFE